MFINKKMVSSMVLATVVTAGVQFTSMPAAEAGLLDNIFGKDNNIVKQIVKEAAGLDEAGIYRTYHEMVENYYKAAHFSSRAAEVGAEVLKDMEKDVVELEAQSINAALDNSATAIDADIRNKPIKKYKTSITDFEAFAKEAKELTKKKDDPRAEKVRTDVVRFMKNREYQRIALNTANKKLAELIAKQALAGDAASGVVQCINAAIQYQQVRNALEKEAGTSMSQLGKAIEKQFKDVKIDKKESKQVVDNLTKG